jgi:hypothetical protein
MTRWFGIIIGVALTGLVAPARGAEIYVDHVNGIDGNDGLAATTQTITNGPVQTLLRATQRAQRGDTIVLVNKSRPIYEPLCLVGASHSGFESKPFTIQGNGVVLSGQREVPADGWREVGPGLWRMSLTRKGYYRFFRENEAIPEFVPTSADTPLADLPLDHYLSRRGAVYFRFERGNTPFTQTWTHAGDDTGVSLVDVRNVRIVNLQIVGFRVDGLNVDGNCRNVVLENVTIEHNGRAGVSANGTSRVTIDHSRVTANGRHSVLVTEAAEANVTESNLGGVEPTVE